MADEYAEVLAGTLTLGYRGCCEHEVEAVNGTEAKRLAIAEHKEQCLKTMTNKERDETIELILDHLFTNGDKVKGDRLLLITEDYCGAAKVSKARYLGGYSRPAIKNLLEDAIRQESTDAE